MKNLRSRVDVLLGAASSRAGAASVILFLAALAVRIGFALWLPDDIVWIDGQRYVRIAESLLAGQGFGSLEMNKISVPTQPVLIALFMAVFDGSYTMVRVGFAALGAFTCVLAYRLGSLVFEPRTGFLAGLILAFYPLHAYASALFEVPQTFFMLTVAGAFCCLYQHHRQRPKRTLFLAGMLFGVSALSVPTVLPFLPWVVVWLGIVERRRTGWLAPAAIFSLGAIVALSPWAIRNYAAYGHVILVNVAGGENFGKANHQTYFEHGKHGATLPCEHDTRDGYCADLARVQAEAAQLGLSENDAIFYADRAGWRGGVAYIREHPGRFLQLFGRKLLTLFSPRPDAVSAASARGASLQLMVSLLSYGPVLVLGLIGWGRTRRRWRHLFPITAYLSTLTVLYSIFLPTVRYRLPIDFFLILFAAHWLVAAMRGSGSGPREPVSA